MDITSGYVMEKGFSTPAGDTIVADNAAFRNVQGSFNLITIFIPKLFVFMLYNTQICLC